LHSVQRMVIPDSRTVPSPMHLSQSTSIVPVPSQSGHSDLPLPSQSLHFILIHLRYASGLWVLSRRSFSIEPNQLDNAFPYSINFSGSFSFLIAKFSSSILLSKICSESSRTLSVMRRVSC